MSATLTGTAEAAGARTETQADAPAEQATRERVEPVAPTVAEAQLVADELGADPSIVKVMLFGSVASNTQDVGSDINLLVVYADLAYDCRYDVEAQLEARSRGLVEPRVSIYATDLPELKAQTEKALNSFLAGLYCRPLLTLHERAPVEADIDWGKEQSLEIDTLTIATRYLQRSLGWELQSLTLLIDVRDDYRETLRRSPNLTLGRLVKSVATAAIVVELSLKSLAHLVVSGELSERRLQRASHNIVKCLKLLPEPYRGALAAVVASAGLDPDQIGGWRAAVYLSSKDSDVYDSTTTMRIGDALGERSDPMPTPDRDFPMEAQRDGDKYMLTSLSVLDVVTAQFEEHYTPQAPVQFAATAVAISGAVLDTYEVVAANNERIEATRVQWEMTKRAYEFNDIRIPERRSTPLDLDEMFAAQRSAAARTIEG